MLYYGGFFDAGYIFVLLGLIISLWASWNVKSTFRDFATHDTNSGNPHCHIMLTMRPLDERGAWAAKSKKEYDLDESGERIRLPSGRYKTHKWKPCSQKKHAERKRLLKERENLLRNLRRKEIRSVQRSRQKQKQKLEILKRWQNIKQSLKKADRTTVRDLKKCEN